MPLEAAACVALFAALASAWAVSFPAGEPPDELFHLMYAAHIAREDRLPVMRPPEVAEVPVEGNQPPLYYRLGAIALRLTGHGTLRVEVPPRNPRSNKVGGAEPAVYEHVATSYPWERIGRATRVLRLVFLPAGALVVLSAYGAARLLRPQDAAAPLLAAGFVASVPQFSFIMGAVTNDSLANGLAAVALFGLVAAVAGGRAGPGLLAILGALVGLGVTVKMTLAFLVPVGLVAAWLAAAPRRKVLGLAAFLVAALAVAAPLLLEYQRNYGDPFGLELNRQMFPQRLHRPGAGYFAGTFLPVLFFSFWGVFGHMNVHLGELYYLFLLVTAACAVGCVLRWRRGVTASQVRVLALCGVTLLALVASIVRYNLIFPQPQGRYAFPGLVVLALLFAEGASELIGARRVWALALVALLALVNLSLLFLRVLPAYAA
jgi:4-amino-4-deoxy-L-arabinose transferase-like glycosyltransferase